MDTKTCNKCKITKFQDQFPILKRGAVGKICKECKNEKNNLLKEEKRRCAVCNKIKNLYDFLQTNKRNLCKECSNEKSRKRRENPAIRNNDIERQRIYKQENQEKILFNKAKLRASKNNIPFEITIKDIIIPKRCPVLDIELRIAKNYMTHNSPTLDRINSNLGYVKRNVMVISWRANSLKKDGTIGELRKILSYMERNDPIGN